mgnify:CR=1 FL=1
MIKFDLSWKDYEDIIIFFSDTIKDYGNFGISINFNADFKYSKILRDLIYHLLTKNNIDYRWKNRFALLTDEIINNAIEHGSNSKQDNIILYIHFSSEEEGLKVNLEVTSFWKHWFRVDATKMEEMRSKKLNEWYDEHESIRWRGLFLIVQQIADKLYFRDWTDWELIVGVDKIFNLS